jgi:hypothetical protein
MPNGYGRGFGRRGGGWGFGFRGSSPPWPYVGLGRGGLPRCGYFLGGAAGIPVPRGYPPYDYAGTPMVADPYASHMTPEQELDFLRNQAEAIREELDQIDGRIKELETE